MPWINVRKLFLLFLAMALLPMSALAAAQGGQTVHLPHLSLLQPFTVSQSASNSPVDVTELTEPTTQSPVSEGHANQDSFAIMNSQRWSSHLRENIDDEHVDVVSDLTAPFYADAGYAYSLVDISWRQSLSTFNHFVGDYRISGWKDTNAMYVALNSQFSA
ncbi:hypothetical protein [Vibrio sp. CAU 1672]|uniref:hypothetical protein n=1 Tax=Vibrio sp. CAU 1672 TaxID=3032594 RepID=UPI0023DCE8E8|nr:hypothetical protein [Vibrio sp. CAU 1672]MDF2155327.1 hypothetical protein [Vibrio sp. CAU 1672]